MTEIRHESRAWVDWQKNFLQDRIRNRHAIIRSILRMWSVQGEIKRSKGELPSIEYARGREFCIFHFLNSFPENFLRWLPVIRSERIKHILIPDPVLQHLRGSLDEIGRYMGAGKAPILVARSNGMQGVTKFEEQGFDFMGT